MHKLKMSSSPCLLYSMVREEPKKSKIGSQRMTVKNFIQGRSLTAFQHLSFCNESRKWVGQLLLFDLPAAKRRRPFLTDSEDTDGARDKERERERDVVRQVRLATSIGAVSRLPFCHTRICFDSDLEHPGALYDTSLQAIKGRGNRNRQKRHQDTFSPISNRSPNRVNASRMKLICLRERPLTVFCSSPANGNKQNTPGRTGT